MVIPGEPQIKGLVEFFERIAFKAGKKLRLDGFVEPLNFSFSH